MNEQINKLALQAREHADSLLGKGLPDMVWQDEYHTKLVELIVKECAEFACQHNLERAKRSHMIHKAIKEHFGVTE